MEVNDFAKQAEIINEYPLGILFNYAAPHGGLMSYLSGEQGEKKADGEMCATHVPFLLVEGQDGKHKLIAHLAGENQHIEMLKKSPNCMVVFQSANSYVTPAWYPQKKQTHKFVPTWDFACVHVYGKAKIIQDEEWLLQMLNSLTDQQEAKRPEGDEFEKKWKVEETDEKYLGGLMKRIVGLEIEITDIQSKFKLHQGAAPVNVNGVLKGYESEKKDDNAKTMCKLTRESYPRDL